MALPITIVNDIAHAALDAIVAGWPANTVPLPDRQYVTNGTVVWDCEQLVVMVESALGTRGDISIEEIIATGFGSALRSVILGACLLRCFPDIDDEGNPPPIDDVEASSEIIFRDSVAILNTLAAAQKAGELGPCNGFAFERWSSESPSGGLAGGTLRFRVLLL